jgi:hypothetical protein
LVVERIEQSLDEFAGSKLESPAASVGSEV